MTTRPAVSWPSDGMLALLAWVLVDEARTRRLRSLLVLVLPVVVIVAVGLAVVVYLSPLAGTAIGGGLSVPAVTVALHRRRTRTR